MGEVSTLARKDEKFINTLKGENIYHHMLSNR